MFNKNLYKQRHFFLLFQMILSSFMSFAQLRDTDGGDGSGTYKSEGEEKLLGKIKEQNEKQIGAIKSFVNEEVTKLKDLSKDNMSADELQKLTSQAAEAQKKIEERFGKIEELAENKEIKDEFKKMQDIMEKQGFELTKLKSTKTKAVNPVVGGADNHVKRLIAEYVKSEDYQNWQSNGLGGSAAKMTLNEDGNLINIDSLSKEEKAELLNKVTSITDDHTGNIFTTQARLNIRDFPQRERNIRDLMNIDVADSVNITAPEVYDYTDAVNGGFDMLSENGEAQEIGFKTKENTWSVKRIAAKLVLSKRYIKNNGTSWIVSYLSTRLTRFIRQKEDFQLLFGDGSGENVDGFTKDAQPYNLVRATYTAGAFASVATWNSGTQTIVTFAAAHGLRNGDNLTIANATNAGYNDTHKSIIVKNELEVIINEAYVVEADTSLWTGSGTSKWYQDINGAQLYDVIVTAKSELQTAEYMATAVVLNPADLDGIGLIKANDLQYVVVARDAFGRANINGLPVATTTAMPSGQYLVGDFDMAVGLSEFTPLTIYAKESTDDTAKNQITFIIEEEFILAKYNPYWFIYGYASDAIAQLETP